MMGYEHVHTAFKQRIQDLEVQQDQHVLFKNVFLTSQAPFYKPARHLHTVSKFQRALTI